MKKVLCTCPGCDAKQPATKNKEGRVTLCDHQLPDGTAKCHGSGISVVIEKSFVKSFFEMFASQ